MSMMYCSECGKEMSDTAATCPNCGGPNKNQAGKRSVSIGLGVGIFLIPIIFSWFTLRKGHTTKAKIISFAWLAVCVLAVIGSGSNQPTPSTVVASAATSQSEVAASQPAKPEEKVIHVSIGKLISDYKNNEVGADNTYKGHLVQVTGIVTSVKKDILDNLYVTIGTGREFEMRQLQAFFSDSMNKKLSSLNKGQKLTVVCRIDGLMMNVLGKKCVIMD